MKKNIDAFLKVLDANDNSTGGGTASGIAGAMAAGMVAMVARLSIGKKNMAAAEHYESIANQGEKLAIELFDGGREDSDAFAHVSTAYRMPKASDQEKAERSQAIQKTMQHATEVPLKNAQGCHDVLALCLSLKDCFNKNAASDLECAEHLAKAGLLGCVANVRINLPSLKDQTVVAAIEKQLDKIEEITSSH
jgi:methenyltetrahydrofolate cyclohydrolase